MKRKKKDGFLTIELTTGVRISMDVVTLGYLSYYLYCKNSRTRMMIDFAMKMDQANCPKSKMLALTAALVCMNDMEMNDLLEKNPNNVNLAILALERYTFRSEIQESDPDFYEKLEKGRMSIEPDERILDFLRTL